ncbi:hypothetical protein EVAR_86163_1 [Eumeta japonica]|uniref:Uncharacterized protein n=1 Tax=Eumeta variegata TaxID=151549 RepID=A0A4C1Z2M9_EUMVA|nr:hypothetical protein EVAR_86163_1 [Eumeta japonica]
MVQQGKSLISNRRYTAPDPSVYLPHTAASYPATIFLFQVFTLTWCGPEAGDDRHQHAGLSSSPRHGASGSIYPKFETNSYRFSHSVNGQQKSGRAAGTIGRLAPHTSRDGRRLCAAE